MHSVASGMETCEYCISRYSCTGAGAALPLGVVMDQALILRPGVPDAYVPPGSAFFPDSTARHFWGLSSLSGVDVWFH